MENLDAMIESLGQSLSLAPDIFFAILIFAGFLIVSKIICKIINKIGLGSDDFRFIIIRTVKIILTLLGLISSLGYIGVDLTAMIAGFGLVGMALSLALKDALNNFISGVMIIFYKSIEIGDKIEIKGKTGTVTKINIRYTTLESDDKIQLIPNSLIFANPLTIFKKENEDD